MVSAKMSRRKLFRLAAGAGWGGAYLNPGFWNPTGLKSKQ